MKDEKKIVKDAKEPSKKTYNKTLREKFSRRIDQQVKLLDQQIYHS